MEDQVFKNKPMEFYLNLSKEGVFSRSDIQLADVPAVFKAQVIDGIKDEKSNRAFDLGTAAHSALIELNTDIFVAAEAKNRTLKAYKDKVKECPDKIVLTTKEHDMVLGMFDSFIGHEKARNIREQAISVEDTFVAKDEETGIMRRCRPDILGANYIADYKTAADLKDLDKKIFNYEYHVQAAQCVDIVQQVTGKVIEHYFLIFQEKSAPFRCQVVKLPIAAIELGRRRLEKNMKVIAECIDTGIWPTLTEEIIEIDLPIFAYSNEVA